MVTHEIKITRETLYAEEGRMGDNVELRRSDSGADDLTHLSNLYDVRNDHNNHCHMGDITIGRVMSIRVGHGSDRYKEMMI